MSKSLNFSSRIKRSFDHLMMAKDILDHVLYNNDQSPASAITADLVAHLINSAIEELTCAEQPGSCAPLYDILTISRGDAIANPAADPTPVFAAIQEPFDIEAHIAARLVRVQGATDELTA